MCYRCDVPISIENTYGERRASRHEPHLEETLSDDLDLYLATIGIHQTSNVFVRSISDCMNRRS